MKKRILAILLLLCLSVSLFAQESDELEKPKPKKGLDWNIRAGFSLPIIPVLDAISVSDGVDGFSTRFMATGITAIVLASATFGGGIQYTVVPGLFAPGVYADLHFNLPSWLLFYLLSERQFMLFQGGIRIYNQFRFGNFSLEPFFGGNFVVVGIDDASALVPFMALGLRMNVKKFGLEYALNFAPKKKADEYVFPRMHRFSFVWRINRLK